jgi:hypothetical protein
VLHFRLQIHNVTKDVRVIQADGVRCDDVH